MAKENPFDPDLVRELANLIADTGLSEIEVEKGDLRIRVARTITAAVTVAAPAALAPPRSSPRLRLRPRLRSRRAPHPGAVLSPMVGTAYRKPSPDAKASSRSAPRSRPARRFCSSRR